MKTDRRELIAYGVFGVLTTLVNYVVYVVSIAWFSCSYIAANILAWILAVAFAFATNKQYVFQSTTWSVGVFFREGWQFFSARFFSLLVETVLLWLFIEKLHCNEYVIKLLTNIIVIVINYVLSKLYIFKKQ
ncbi:MAG: GtrA family protein [Desulfovibrio sp.]|nr:GtrA family protein [Desulfovibrio sp.]